MPSTSNLLVSIRTAPKLCAQEATLTRSEEITPYVWGQFLQHFTKKHKAIRWYNNSPQNLSHEVMERQQYTSARVDGLELDRSHRLIRWAPDSLGISWGQFLGGPGLSEDGMVWHWRVTLAPSQRIFVADTRSSSCNHIITGKMTIRWRDSKHARHSYVKSIAPLSLWMFFLINISLCYDF